MRLSVLCGTRMQVRPEGSGEGSAMPQDDSPGACFGAFPPPRSLSRSRSDCKELPLPPPIRHGPTA